MPIFRLIDEIIFPDPNLADENGIIAVGGDLCTERLLEAYRAGIFPWYSDDEPIIWWSPDPRFILLPDEIIIHKSMKKLLKKNKYTVTFDTAFDNVINNCRKTREHIEGTWITNEMQDAYNKLHKEGFCHSVEVWNEKGELSGGLYGISLGKCFFGESMFSLEPNTSKIALIYLAKSLKEKGFILIDCQVYTKHLETLGAKLVTRNKFLGLLEKGIKFTTLKGNWKKFFQEENILC